jgi:hypothetical protein
MVTSWAKEELETADLGDERLDRRAVVLLSALRGRPNLSIPAACGGQAEMKAAYRFFDNDKVTFEKVLAPHIERTRERVGQQAVVLLVQDSTELDLTRPEQVVAGVGDLDGARQGVVLHEMQAYTTEGTPLGTAWAEIVNRTEGVSHASAAAKRKKRKQQPIEEKESLRWLTGLRQGRALSEQTPQTQCIVIADSEADIYELLVEPRGERPVHWLIRAGQNRAVLEGETDAAQLWREQLLETPRLDAYEVSVRGRRAKTAAEDRARKQNRESRVEVRAATLTLRPPHRADRKLPPVTVNVVLVREPNPPPGEPPVEWLLVTTLPIDTLEQVRTIVAYYCVRWNIEVFFRTLKSGCRIEQRRFEDIDRVLPYLAISLIVVWRIQFVCHLGREFPDLDCEVVFESSEWQAVWVAVERKKPPRKVPRLREMVHQIASLGGYIERRNSEPGTQTLWIGMQRMYDLAWAWEMFRSQAKIQES